MVWTGAHEGEARRVVDALAKAQRLEGDQPLIMVHGQDCVVLAVVTAAEEAVGGEGAGHDHVLLLGFEHRRADHFALFFADRAVVARVRVESQHGNYGSLDAEVTLKRGAHDAQLLENAVFGDQRRYPLQRGMIGHEADP